MYADLHCHPGAAAFDRTPVIDDPAISKRNPWHIPQSDLQLQTKGIHPNGYSQCDLAKSVTAGARLLFTALYPCEKGFFTGLSGGRLGKKMITEFYRRIHTDGKPMAVDWLLENVRTQPEWEHLEKSSFNFLSNRPLNYSFDRVRFMQDSRYDYFQELKREYKFYRCSSGLPGVTSEPLQLYPNGQTKNWSGTYHLTKSGTDVRQKFNSGKDDISMVLTIEGIHALGIGNPDDDGGEKGIPGDVTIGKLKSRIRQLKGEEPLEDAQLQYWEHRPFFLTFAHHFNNTLCGHARSFPVSSSVLLNQCKNMDKGVLRQGAFEVMQELLGLDEKMQSTGSKRILIDVKHMSASSRSDYYKNIIRPYNNRMSNVNNRIPVVASNVAYSGIDRLEVMTNNAWMDKESDGFRINKFLGWSINLCDEDIIEIHHSNGLIGLSFDERLLGRDPERSRIRLPLEMGRRKKSVGLLERTISQFVRIPFAYNLDNPLQIWNCLCLGTGFDGAMEPIQRYPTVLQFNVVEEDLVEILEKMKREEPLWFGPHKPEQLARKICFENAYDFVVKHY